VATSFGVSSLLPHMHTINSSLRTGMASITGSAIGGSALDTITTYHSYFQRVSSAPLRSEDGDAASFSIAPLEQVAVENDEGALPHHLGAPSLAVADLAPAQGLPTLGTVSSLSAPATEAVGFLAPHGAGDGLRTPLAEGGAARGAPA